MIQNRNDRGLVVASIASLLSQQFDIPKMAMEFGAGNGTTHTVTRTVICKLAGWRGLWIEPHPQVFARMQRVVELDKLPVEALNIAVSTLNGVIPFYPCITCEGYVECRRLPRILRPRGPVGIMVCDIEEHDTAVMADMLRSPVRPAVLMVESMPAYQEELAGLLKNDYSQVWQFPRGLDKVYVRRDLLEIAG
jgi:hypothetical protein